ncbi:polysaccharide deacetylase family protein [Acetanaerobacterium elongatum]|uniref:Delta-lactam-biosynthetic de-N-acetylase n=1 Tax=Acetanaerobacterium elongatum TaxID=258515 RepID=A0A1H0CUI7_9FIRM|nr:polysaccharide deacetylase family protein [Acetanaerobacterium elongatum]SDN61537.1 delta-lactam-biosynthetic de-N-acetylase [Acetanaerobacterium elongatum]
MKRICKAFALLAAMLFMLTSCTYSLLGSSSTPSTAASSAAQSSAPASSLPPDNGTSTPQVDSSGPVKPEAPVKPVISPEYEDLAALSNEKVQWGPGNQFGSDGRPTGPVSLQKKYGKYGAYFISPDKDSKKIYLTFDEGYENGFTAKILDTLKEKGVSAVFFVTYDYAKRNPELVQRMIDEGHIVGNHSTTHPSMPDLSLDEAKKEIQTLHDYVLQNFGYEMWLFRPPQGDFSERTLALAHSLGYLNIFWSFAYKDWDVENQIGYDAALAKVTKNPHAGGIYLLHAVSKDNSEILGSVIDNFTSKGYTLSTFDLSGDTAAQTKTESSRSTAESSPVSSNFSDTSSPAKDAVVIK